MSKLKRDLKTEPIPDKAMRGAQIITACTGNSNIGTVTTELTAFTTANTKLETDYNAAQAAAAHAIQLTTVQNDSDADWNAKFESLALVLERNTGGDKMKLETTTIDTFEPGRAPAVGAPAKVGNVAVTLGYLGTVPSSYPINSVYHFSRGPEEGLLRIALRPQRRCRQQLI